MTTVRVTETFLDAQGTPVTGKVLFEPWVYAVDGTPDPGAIVTQQTIAVPLDQAGAIDVVLTSSWDDGWLTADGSMPYRVTVAVAGMRAAFSALIPPVAGQTEVTLHDLVDLGADPDVVVVPVPGPSAVSADAGNAATLGSDSLIYVAAAGGPGAVSSVNGETGAVVLDAADVGADPAGTASGALAAHEAAADPHPGYLSQGEGDGRYVPATAPAVVMNADHTKYGLTVRRTDPALSTADPEIFAVYYGTGTSDDERGTWTNEKGQLRTSNIPAPAEDALKVIGANSATGNALAIVKQDGTSLVRVGPAGTLIAELGLRLVAGAAAGRVLVGDGSGNATWQIVPVATGSTPPASPYTGQLWADPN